MSDPPKDPNEKATVAFQSNHINAEQMKGAYFQWKLIGKPDVAVVNPAASKPLVPFTLSCESIRCDRTTGTSQFFVFTPAKNEENTPAGGNPGDGGEKAIVVTYPSKEDIILTGPDQDQSAEEDDGAGDKKLVITMTGATGGLATKWVLKEDDEKDGDGGGQKPSNPGGKP